MVSGATRRTVVRGAAAGSGAMAKSSPSTALNSRTEQSSPVVTTFTRTSCRGRLGDDVCVGWVTQLAHAPHPSRALALLSLGRRMRHLQPSVRRPRLGAVAIRCCRGNRRIHVGVGSRRVCSKLHNIAQGVGRAAIMVGHRNISDKSHFGLDNSHKRCAEWCCLIRDKKTLCMALEHR